MVALLAVFGLAVVVLLVVTLRLARRGHAAGGGDGAQARAPAARAQTANVAVVTLYEIWMGRVEREKLGARDDTWAELSSTPQYASWRRLAEVRGAGDDVQHYMTRSLLSEVIYAAGGVERELQQLRRALADAQRSAGEAGPAPSPATQARATSSYVAARPMREASYSFVNLLSWARSTVERTDRPYRPGSSGRAGLLAALRPGELHDSVEAALQHLRTALRDSRLLASYAFHAGAVSGDGAPGTEKLPDGRHLAQLAPPPAGPAPAGEALEFTEDRDMLAYATELMAAVEVFVNRVLDAFAGTRPAHPRS